MFKSFQHAKVTLTHYSKNFLQTFYGRRWQKLNNFFNTLILWKQPLKNFVNFLFIQFSITKHYDQQQCCFIIAFPWDFQQMPSHFLAERVQKLRHFPLKRVGHVDTLSSHYGSNQCKSGLNSVSSHIHVRIFPITKRRIMQ